jgi:hypothetical protein
MPDGVLTVTKFLGVKNNFFELPSSPQLGDAWQVLEGAPHLWVWYRLPTHTVPAWVDPSIVSSGNSAMAWLRKLSFLSRPSS